MNSYLFTRIRQEDSGMAMIEILVSAFLLIIVAVGVFTAFDSGTRATAEERHRARAHSLAEADVERMRAMRIADLAFLDQTRTVNQDGLDYTIRSQAQFTNDPTTTSTCAAGTGSNDNLKVSSTVTWPSIGSRPPVVVTSLVAPPNGSIVPNSGSLLVNVRDSRDNPLPGVSLSGTGIGTFSGTTGPSGCVLWRNLPAGNYSMGVSGVASDKVDVDGNPPEPQPVSIVAESTNTVTRLYDTPGSIEDITFRTRDYNGQMTSSADAVVVDHTGMNTARVFTAPGGVRATSISTTATLFPFTSPYAVYAGTCGANNPQEGNAIGFVTVPIGGVGSLPPPGRLMLPALHLTVHDNTNTGNSDPVANAQVKIRDNGCNGFLRNFTTNTQGRLDDPGMPWSTYEVCVSGVASNGQTRYAVTGSSGSPPDPVVQNSSSGTDLDMFLRGSGSQAGTCP